MSDWTLERENAAMERRASPYCGTAWWVTGDPWGDELSVHAGPSNDPHLAVLTVCSFDTMSEQFRPEFDGTDCGDVDEIGREVMRCIVADHEDVMVAIGEIQRLRNSLESTERENRLRRAELNALNDRLAWSNVNGGMAYVLRGVGHVEIWKLLRDARDEQRAIEEGTKHDD